MKFLDKFKKIPPIGEAMANWGRHESRETAKVIREIVKYWYESFKMEEIVELVIPGLSLEAFEQGQFATCLAIATGYPLRSALAKGASLVRDGFQQTRRTEQLLQLLEIQPKGQHLCNPRPLNPSQKVR